MSLITAIIMKNVFHKHNPIGQNNTILVNSSSLFMHSVIIS